MSMLIKAYSLAHTLVFINWIALSHLINVICTLKIAEKIFQTKSEKIKLMKLF